MSQRLHCAMAIAAVLTSTLAARAAEPLVFDGGFEHSEPAWGRPLDAEWGGDPVAFVGPTAGVTPFDGSSMVQFLATSCGDDLGNVSSDIWQIVDLAEHRDLVRSSDAVVSAIGWCNRTATGPHGDTLFAIDIQAFAGDRSLYLAAPQDHLARAVGSVRTDADPSTWEPVSTTLRLPPDTEFVVIRFHANEDVRNDVVGPELSGHFGDGVTVTLGVADEGVRTAGDANADGTVDVDDYLAVVRRLGSRHRHADLDANGIVGLEDVVEVTRALAGR